MRDFGDMPQWLIDAHIELFRAQDQGWTSVVSPDLKEILQRNPKNFDEFLQDNIITFREEYLNYCKYRKFDENSFFF
jgi:hypothetical protein